MILSFDTVSQLVSPGATYLLMALTCLALASVAKGRLARVGLAMLAAGFLSFMYIPPCGDLDGFWWGFAGCFIWG